LHCYAIDVRRQRQPCATPPPRFSSASAADFAISFSAASQARFIDSLYYAATLMISHISHTLFSIDIFSLFSLIAFHFHCSRHFITS